MAVRIVTIDEVAADRADAVVVIDVLRAFTTAPWCWERGATAILLAGSVEQALDARAGQHPGALLLKDGAPDPRFELVNSPALVQQADLAGRTVIQQTTNGTRGAFAAAGRPLVPCAGFVTASATVRVLDRSGADDVALVVTGGDEDLALAELILARLDRGVVDPTPFLDRARRSAAACELERLAQRDDHPGIHPDDIELCLELDRFATVPRAAPDGDLLRLVPG